MKFIKVSNSLTNMDCYLDSTKIIGFCSVIDKEGKQFTEIILIEKVTIRSLNTMEEILLKIKGE